MIFLGQPSLISQIPKFQGICLDFSRTVMTNVLDLHFLICKLKFFEKRKRKRGGKRKGKEGEEREEERERKGA